MNARAHAPSPPTPAAGPPPVHASAGRSNLDPGRPGFPPLRAHGPPTPAKPPGTPPAGRAGPPAHNPPTHGPSHAKSRGWWRPVLVIAVIAVGVVLVLALVPLLEAPRTVYGSPFSFSSFYAPASSSGLGAPGGPWTPVVAFGVAISYDERGTLGTEGLGGGNCSAVWTQNSTPELLATPSGALPGEVSAWFLFSINATDGALLTIASNTSGSVNAVAAAVVPQSCLVGIAGYAPLNGSIVDSTQAAATADLAGGTTFLASNPGATQEFLAADNTWTVVYSTCAFSGSSGSGTEFVANVGALSGALIQAETLASVPCSA